VVKLIKLAFNKKIVFTDGKKNHQQNKIY